jgi:hypothetical protein
MNKNGKYFSEEYDPDSVTDTELKEKEISEYRPEGEIHQEPYELGKPRRTIIRAKITHD